MSAERKFADELSSVLQQIDDLNLEAKAIIDAAKEVGVNTKALRKVAKEMLMDSAKLMQKFDDEDQLEMFRDQVGLKARKGLSFAEAAE